MIIFNPYYDLIEIYYISLLFKSLLFKSLFNSFIILSSILYVDKLFDNIFDKNDISKHKNVKIDILSSRGISQLIGICGRNIDFSNCPYDKKTYELNFFIKTCLDGYY